MWFRSQEGNGWEDAVEHLTRADPVMRRMIQRVGPCMLRRRRDYFVALCQAIFTQQVSTAVATVLFGRFRTLFPNRRPTPQRVLELTDAQLSFAGLSRQKKLYIRDLAVRFASCEVPVRRFARMSDQEIIEALLPVKGVGRWTAEMFLIFVLNRPDLLPVDDLGVRKIVQGYYRLRKLPDGPALHRIAEPWKPWRTIATWYLWRTGGLDAAENGRR